MRTDKQAKLLTPLFIVPICLGLIFSFFTPLLLYFRFLYLVPIMAILLAYGATTTMYRYIVVTGLLIFSLTYLLFPQFHREDWKSLAKSRPKDMVIYMIVSSSDPLLYYDPQAKLKDLRELKNAYEDSLFVIPYAADIHGVDYKKSLQKQKYKITAVENFGGVDYELWKR